MSPCPWTVNFTSTFQFSPNFRGLELDSPFLQVSYALIKSQKVIGSGRTISSEKQALLRRIKCSGTFQIGFFSLPPAWSKRGFFSSIHWVPGKAPGGKTYQVSGLSVTGTPWRFYLRLVNPEHPANWWLQLRFSYPDLIPGEVSASEFLLW